VNGLETAVEETPRLAALAELTKPLAGWLNTGAARQIYRLAREVAPGEYVVELGTGSGKHGAWLAAGVRDRGHGRYVAVDTFAAPGAVAALNLAPAALANLAFDAFRGVLRAADAESCSDCLRAPPLHAGLDWPHGVAIGLLHLPATDDYATLRRLFELWSRFVVLGGLVVFDGAPGTPAPSRLVMELPRWWRWYRNCLGKWIAIKTEEPEVPHR
jgi:hypothetical protein